MRVGSQLRVAIAAHVSFAQSLKLVKPLNARMTRKHLACVLDLIPHFVPCVDGQEQPGADELGNVGRQQRRGKVERTCDQRHDIELRSQDQQRDQQRQLPRVCERARTAHTRVRPG